MLVFHVTLNHLFTYLPSLSTQAHLTNCCLLELYLQFILLNNTGIVIVSFNYQVNIT